MEAPPDVVPSVEAPPATHDDSTTKPALTPPTSEDNDKRFERMSSELSELDSDDGEDIEPDHYFEGGKIPVFKPVGCLHANNLLPRPRSTRAHVMTMTRGNKLDKILTIICTDNGPVSQFQALHRQDRQAWNEVGYRQGYSTSGMVSLDYAPVV